MGKPNPKCKFEIQGEYEHTEAQREAKRGWGMREGRGK
jgi:hypothetical protein